MDFIRLQKGVLTFVDTVLINISIVFAFLLKFGVKPGSIPSEILDNAVLIVFIITFVKITLFYLFRL